MTPLPHDLNFGLAWIAFAVAVALHVADEATHDFLAVYNPSAQAIRRRLHVSFFPPVFTPRSFVISLSSAVALLFLLSPLAFHPAHWLLVTATPLAILIGLGNGCLHIGASISNHRWMPGVFTAPLLLATGSWLLCAAL